MSEAWINYDEEPESEPREKWRHTDLKSHWKSLHAEKYESFGQWGIKETTLLSKLMSLYKPMDIASMMDWWFANAQSAHSFGAFYKEHAKVYEATREWEW